MQTLSRLVEGFRELMESPLIRLGSAEMTVGTFVQLVVLIPLLFVMTGVLRRWLIRVLATGQRLDAGMREAVATVVRYIILAIGLLIIIQTAGVDLTALNVLAAGLGLGVGFGLQNIASNFISGLIILFERPVKLGDRVVVGDIEGDVVAINARSTTVVSNDNIAVIVPNSRFVTETVVNWSHGDNKVRFKIPVTVAYGTDLKLAQRLLLEIAASNPDVLDHPPPSIRLMKFGDNGLELELRAWTITLMHRRGLLLSALNFAIHDAFYEHGIAFPFPQRDLHVRGGRLDVAVQMEPAGDAPQAPSPGGEGTA